MENNLIYESLHCHTSTSDGFLTHAQVLDECFKNKIRVVAFTDHDLFPKPDKIKTLKKLNHPVKFITGIEISCDFLHEVKERISVHVTGLFVDLENSELIKFSQRQLELRHWRMGEYVRRLTQLGFTISVEDVLDQVKGEAVGQPHIVAALSERKENWKILEGYLKELEELSKDNSQRKKQFDEILSREERTKWYVLVMGKDALHSVHVDYSPDKPIQVDDAVRLIRGAGGIALIAHWSYLRDIVTFDILEKLMKEKRIDGMETVYSFGVEFNKDLFAGDMLKLSDLCTKYNLVQGGGGDFHRREDFSLMVNPGFSHLANRTIGLLDRIVKIHPNLNLKWTTL